MKKNRHLMKSLITSPVITQNLFIRLKADGNNFDNIVSITDPNVLILALKTANLFQQALVPAENDSLRFDVQKGLELAKSDPNLSVTNFTDIYHETSDSRTSVMTEMVLKTINTVLGIALAPEPAKQLQAAIEGAYVGLNEKKDDAWIFWEKKQAHKTTYQYNITFSVEAGATGLILLTCPMGLTIEVNKEYERVLFITLKDTESYLSRIQALTTAQLAKPALSKSANAEGYKLLEELVGDGPTKIE